MVDDEPVTLVELLCQAAARRPSIEVLRFKRDKVWIGIRGEELRARVRSIALALRELGVRKGDTVAMLAESGPLWSITDYAILCNGGVNVPLYPTQPVEQVEYILRDSRPRLMFVSTARQMRRIAEVLRRFPDLRIITFQPGVEGENVTSFDELERRGEALSKEEPGAFEAMTSDVKPGDLASIIYTSGTTGEPKGAMLTHANVVFNAVTAGRFLGIEEGGVMLSYLPLSHIFERMVLYLCMHFGVQINYAGGIETVANDMKEVHPTLMSTVPRMLEKVYSRMQKNAKEAGRLKKMLFDWSLEVGRSVATLSSESRRIPPIVEFKREIADRLVFIKLREAVGGRIKRMVSGGAALPSDIAMVFTGAGIPVLQGYGLTETSPVIAVNTNEANRIGSVGRVLPGIDLKIAEDGEILTRGQHVFRGYFNKAEETAHAFIDAAENGSRWFRTGDIGYLDPDGFLYITDRKKDLIKTSAGKYVAPQMIERILENSEYIEQAVVIGDKRKYVSALIVPDFGTLRGWAKAEGIEPSTNRELVDDRRVLDMIKGEVTRLTSGLADYEKVKRVALLPDEFTIDGGELTPTLKVKRRVVEEKYRQLINSLYGGDGEE